MKVLSIDQSYTNTGYCLLDDTSMLECGLITSDKSKDVFDRAVEITNKIIELISKHTPTEIALEGLAFGMMGNATRDLAGLQFTIVNAIRAKGYKISIIAPNTVKKVATGKGNAKKEELLQCLPLNIKTFFEVNIGAKKSRGLYDLTDAYWIGQTILRQQHEN